MSVPGQACCRGSTGDRIALKTSGRVRGTQISGNPPVAEPRDGQTSQFERAQRAIQSDEGTTSDQEGTEEILERTGMARFGRGWQFLQDTAGNETLGVVWQHWQNRDWNNGRGNSLDTGE
jgi:hypothetical protein